MELALLVYAIGLLNNITGVLFFTVGISVLIAFGYFVDMDSYSHEAKNLHRWNMTKRWMCIATVAAVTTAFIPTEKTAYVMVGAYAAQKVAENEKVQALSVKVLKVIEQNLDNYIDQGVKKLEGKK